jgi:hypothetical protein
MRIIRSTVFAHNQMNDFVVQVSRLQHAAVLEGITEFKEVIIRPLVPGHRNDYVVVMLTDTVSEDSKVWRPDCGRSYRKTLSREKLIQFITHFYDLVDVPSAAMSICLHATDEEILFELTVSDCRNIPGAYNLRLSRICRETLGEDEMLVTD